MHLHSPVLALSPDSLANLGDLDGDSLSELWGVFTKCKHSLQNGQRLENLSWRLWFDSARRAHEAAIAAAHQANVSLKTTSNGTLNLDAATEEEWSDPEWTEATDSESDDNSVPVATASAQQNPSTMAVPTRPSLQAGGRPSTSNTLTCTATGSSTRPVILKDWRSSSTISGGSIQRILTSAPISLPPKAQSVANVDHTHQPLLSPRLAAGLSSRHSSAPEQFDPVLAGSSASRITSQDSSSPPLALPLPPSPRKWVDARTQTTPSNSHRPSPKIPSTPLAMSPTPPVPASNPVASIHVNAVAGPSAIAPATATTISSRSMVRTSSSTSSNQFSLPRRSGKAGTRRHSSPKPPPPTPATSILVAQPVTNGHTANGSVTSPLSNPSFEARSYVKGFDTSVFESRPQNGSIAPPPTPAVALSSLPACSPVQRRTHVVSDAVNSSSLSRSALKSPPSSAAVTATSGPSKAKSMQAAPSKKIFFISSPNSDSEDDASSSRSRGASIGQYLSDGQRQSSGLSTEVKKIDEGNSTAAEKQTSATAKATVDQEEEEWSDDDAEDDDASSSGWGSEYSTSSSTRARSKEHRRDQDETQGKGNPLFAKRPSEVALNRATSELKPRPPGLLSQLFHPDLFIEDADRTHSYVDITRANGASLRAPGTSGQSMLTTSKSTGVLSEQMRSKSFLRGRPEGVELESSSDEGEPEQATVDEQGAHHRSGAVAAALARHQERSRLEAMQPIAPPQTPRTTRRAMLATELSESLRRNLLWERQTRNRALGAATVNRFAAAAAQPAKPQQQQAQAFPNATVPQPRQPAVTTAARVQSDTGLADVARQVHQASAAAPTAAEQLRQQRSPLLDGVRAPHPSPATQSSHASRVLSSGDGDPTSAQAGATANGAAPASGEMKRRHTTGTGLYLAAQRGKLSKHHHRPGSAENSSDESDSESDSSLSSSSSSESSTAAARRRDRVASTRTAVRRVGETGGAGAGDDGGGHIRRVKSGVRKKDLFGDPWGQRVW